MDVRPFLFVIGLPLWLALSLLVAWLGKAKFRKRNVMLFSAALFVALFTFFLTGFGPCVDQQQIRTFTMTWIIQATRSNPTKQTEVVFRFVDFPGYEVGVYSDELAAYLRERGEQPVKVVFAVTYDYGKVRGFHELEIAGRRPLPLESGYAGVYGIPTKSPWE